MELRDSVTWFRRAMAASRRAEMRSWAAFSSAIIWSRVWESCWSSGVVFVVSIVIEFLEWEILFGGSVADFLAVVVGVGVGLGGCDVFTFGVFVFEE